MDLKLPCDNAEIHFRHEFAMEETKDLFKAEMSGISTTTVEKQLKELKVTPLSSSLIDFDWFSKAIYFAFFTKMVHTVSL